MGRLQVDRQAALDWLGIETYRPSGRVAVPTISASDVAATGVESRRAVTEAPAGSGQSAPAATVEPSEAKSAPAITVSSDQLRVTADSPHRPLAEAIARVARLSCETDADGDVLIWAGETWELSALAADGRAKRQLWQALIAGGRRARR